MMNKFIYISLLCILFFSARCTLNDNKEINKVLLCALDQLKTDNEFKNYLIDGNNYIAWVEDGYVTEDSILTIDGKMAWQDLPFVKVNTSFVEYINCRFPEGHKLSLISQSENEKLLKNNGSFRSSHWFFGGLKKYKNRYFLNGGFAVSTQAGIGASFVIEIIDQKCQIIDYHNHQFFRARWRKFLI